ncbi:MAG: selenocysteine-specific translation elongation factor [Actinomycetota bacterium]
MTAEPGTDPPLHVIATAGHVDHGKSSLIRRMSGIEPDRLEEERRRGLTIDLGFAWCTLPSGREVGFVDVPGHERFVRTMLAGVGPVRLVLFVVAADEGWKTQSEEHLAIVDVLGVHGAVVALTKRDLVDEERLVAAEAEVRDRLRGTALEGAPIVPCSSVTGAGVDDLTASLDAMIASAPPESEDERPRLFVDRVFTIAGAGTVVTGTLTGGRIGAGEDVEAHPASERARIRSLQTHRRGIETARPVSRVALNLAGVDRARLERGDVISRPGDWRPTSLLEARLRPVRGLVHPLTARGAFTLHAGAAERVATLRLYDVATVPAGGAFARIRLSAPLVLDVHDRFVLRESGRHETVAGGVVLDPAPPRRPAGDAAERLGRREHASREELPGLLLAERGAVADADLRLLTGRDSVPGAEPTGRWWVRPDVHDAVVGALLEHVRAFHASNPGALGVDAPEIQGLVVRALRAAGAPSAAVLSDALVDDLVRSGLFAWSGRSLRLADHEAGVAAGEVERLVSTVAAGEPTPPALSELRAAGFASEAIDAALREGRLVRIAPDLVLTTELVQRAIGAVRGAGTAGITVSAVRQAIGTSRKYAVPLLEHLDRTGVTRRSGDLRFPRGS